MKYLLSIFLVLCFVSLACADVTGTIVGKFIDENGNIVIQTAYHKDGVNVESRYPPKDGVYYWQTRYTIQNFVDMSQEEQEARILQDVSTFAKQLISQDYITKANADLMQGQMLQGIVGKSVTETTADIQVSPTEVWVAKTDGTMTTKAITP